MELFARSAAASSSDPNIFCTRTWANPNISSIVRFRLRVPVHKHRQLYRQSSNYEGRGHKRRHPLANRGPIFGRGHRSVRWVPLHCSLIVTPSAQCVIGIFLPPAWCARLSTRCRPARVSAERIYRRPGLTSQPIKSADQAPLWVNPSGRTEQWP
jgi:hypothetical protein